MKTINTFIQEENQTHRGNPGMSTAYLLSSQILPPAQPGHLSEVDPPSPSLPLLLGTPLYSTQLFLERNEGSNVGKRNLVSGNRLTQHRNYLPGDPSDANHCS